MCHDTLELGGGGQSPSDGPLFLCPYRLVCTCVHTCTRPDDPASLVALGNLLSIICPGLEGRQGT